MVPDGCDQAGGSPRQVQRHGGAPPADHRRRGGNRPFGEVRGGRRHRPHHHLQFRPLPHGRARLGSRGFLFSGPDLPLEAGDYEVEFTFRPRTAFTLGTLGEYPVSAEEALATGADYIVSTDSSCLMHLEAYIKKQNISLRTLHIADVLASGW